MSSPVLIQTGYNNTIGVQLAPFLHNGNYFVPLTNATNSTGTLSMFKSTDSGATWINVGDALVGLVDSVFTACFDGHHSLLCMAEVTTSGGEQVLIAYDMDAQSWGVPFAGISITPGSGPTGEQVLVRPDGSVVGIDDSNFWVWDGLVWTAFAAFTNIPAPFIGGINEAIKMNIDASGLIHAVAVIRNAGDTEQAFFYQQFTIGNTLGNSDALTSVDFPDADFDLQPTNVIINNTKSFIMFAVLDTSQKARVFASRGPLTTPIWGISLAFTDSATLSTDFGFGPGLANFNDTQVWMVHPQSDDTTFSEYGTSDVADPLLGWALVGTFVAPQALTIFGSNWGVTADSVGSGFFTEEIGLSFTPESFFIATPAPPPAPPLGPGPFITGGAILSLSNGLDSALGCMAVRPGKPKGYRKGCQTSAIKTLVYRVPSRCKP